MYYVVKYRITILQIRYVLPIEVSVVELIFPSCPFQEELEGGGREVQGGGFQ